uniref:Uncharacterized protein n=1 Tax=Acrobeloides nanus TaxID=290746 RepID=A0A914C0N6_9BILA
MKLFYALLFCGLFLTQDVYGAAFSGSTKTKFINKLETFLSSYLSAAQYTTLMNQIEQDFYNGASISTIGSSLITRALAVLQFSQTLQMGGIAATLALQINVPNSLTILYNVVYNNLGPFYTGQVCLII